MMRANTKHTDNGETVTLTDQFGVKWRYHVKWNAQARRYTVRALDENWHTWVHPADVPFPTARNIAIEAVDRFEGGAS